MLRSFGIFPLLTCLLLQWIPDSLHIFVHANEEHTQHAFPVEGQITFDVPHKHCQSPEKAIHSAWFPALVSVHFLSVDCSGYAAFYSMRLCVHAFDFKSGRAPPAAIGYC